VKSRIGIEHVDQGARRHDAHHRNGVDLDHPVLADETHCRQRSGGPPRSAGRRPASKSRRIGGRRLRPRGAAHRAARGRARRSIGNGDAMGILQQRPTHMKAGGRGAAPPRQTRRPAPPTGAACATAARGADRSARKRATTSAVEAPPCRVWGWHDLGAAPRPCASKNCSERSGSAWVISLPPARGPRLGERCAGRYTARGARPTLRIQRQGSRNALALVKQSARCGVSAMTTPSGPDNTASSRSAERCLEPHTGLRADAPRAPAPRTPERGGRIAG